LSPIAPASAQHGSLENFRFILEEFEADVWVLELEDSAK